MSQVSPEAQALVDRLAAMDLANPRKDTAAVERAITAQLNALGLPGRPYVWEPDAASGYARLFRQFPPDVDIIDPAWREARNAVIHGVWDQAVSAAYEIVWDAIRLTVWLTIKDTSFETAWENARGASGDDDTDVRRMENDPVWLDADYGAEDAATAIALIGSLGGFERSGSISYTAAWLAMVDAFEAGLFLYWVMPDEIVCVLSPSLSIENCELRSGADLSRPVTQF